jgi:hypothetical protein
MMTQSFSLAVKHQKKLLWLGVVWLLFPGIPLLMYFFHAWFATKDVVEILKLAGLLLVAPVIAYFDDDFYQILYNCSYAIISGKLFISDYATQGWYAFRSLSAEFLRGAYIEFITFWPALLVAWIARKLTVNSGKWQRGIGLIIAAIVFWIPFSIEFNIFVRLSQCIWNMGPTIKRLIGISYSLGTLFVLLGFFLGILRRNKTLTTDERVETTKI